MYLHPTLLYTNMRLFLYLDLAVETCIMYIIFYTWTIIICNYPYAKNIGSRVYRLKDHTLPLITPPRVVMAPTHAKYTPCLPPPRRHIGVIRFSWSLNLAHTGLMSMTLGQELTRIVPRRHRINTWYSSTVQTQMTTVIRRQTSPFNCGTPLLCIGLYHYYKSFIMRSIKKNRIAVHTKNKTKIKVDESMYKFTRRQVSSELNNLKMYNIHCVRSPVSSR